MVNTTAWGGWASDGNCDGYIYYYDQDKGNGATIETLTLPTADNKVFTGNFADTQASDCYSKIYITAGYGGETKPTDYTGQTTTIGKIVMADGVLLSIAANPWQGTWKKYTLLTIDNLYIGDGTGTGKFAVTNAADNVVIESISGKLGGLDVSGKLTLGEGLNEAKNNKVTFVVGGENATSVAASGELVVASNATLQFADYDSIAHGTANQTITLDGGIWEANGSRQSLGENFTINLINGTIQNTTGRDGGANGSKYGVVDIAKSGAKIVASGTSSITGGIRLRGHNLTIEVAEGGTLGVDSFFRQGSTTGGIVKQGDGTLKITTMAANAANEAFYTGDTTLKAGIIEYALASGTGSYSGTISGTDNGTGNIVKSGAGTVTLAAVRNLDGNISVTGGTLNITSLIADKAMDISVTGGTLNITSLIADKAMDISVTGGSLDITSLTADKTMGVSVTGDNLKIARIEVDAMNHQLTDITPEGSEETYFTNDGSAHTISGFKVEDKTYLLFDGFVWNGTVSGFTVGSQDGDTTLIKSGVGTIYYVNGGETHTISEESDYIKGRASRYYVEEDSTLVIDSDQKTITDENGSSVLSAAQLLTETVGAGNITLNTDIKLAAGATSQVTGTLTIQDCRLAMENGRNAKYNLTSFNAVTLDNGSVRLRGDAITLDNVTITSRGGTIECHDIEDMARPYKLTGTTTLEGTLSIETTSWRHVTNIEKLVGVTGAKLVVKDNLPDTQKDGSHNETIVNIGNITGYSGAIEVIRNHEAITEIKATTNGKTSLSSVLLKNGGAFTMLNLNQSLQTTITSLIVDGAGTLGTTRSSACYQGIIDVKSLSHTGNSAALTLMNGSQCDATSTINLNGGSLKGSINVESNAAAGADQNRKLQVNINASDLAKDAVINFRDPSTGNTTGNNDLLDNNKQGNYNILGVGAETVNVAGLTGETTNAATIKSTNSSTRTLQIITAQGADYKTNAEVENSVNLVKSGEGAQTFTGSVASTSISVLGGGLSLTGIEKLQLQDLVVKSGATLSVGSNGSGVVSFVNSTAATASTTSSTQGAKAKLEGGATINGGLDLSAATSLTLDGVESNAVKINGDLKLTTGSLTLSGDVLNSIASLRAGEQLKIFGVMDGFCFFVGGTQYSEALTANNGIILDTIFSSEDINLENYYLGFYNIPDEAGYSTVYIGMIVPEPTTATLSLLALAALAARRRRK